MKYTTLFVILAICVMAAPKVEVKALVESLCGDCIQFTNNELKDFMNTPSLMEITDLEIVPFGKASIISENPPVFQCQHGEPECYGNKVELCSLAHSNQGLNMMNCMQAKRRFDNEAIAVCASECEIESAPIIECVNNGEGDKLMIRAGKMTPKLSFVPSILVNGELHDDPQNIVKYVCNAYTGKKPAICENPSRKDVCFN